MQLSEWLSTVLLILNISPRIAITYFNARPDSSREKQLAYQYLNSYPYYHKALVIYLMQFLMI